MLEQVRSLKYYYGEKELEQKSIKWIESYLPWLSDDSLCSIFNDVFGESASLFNINGNSKKTIESLMINYYHNEAYIKSAFMMELIKHKAVSFFELPVSDSRIDLCSINGNSIAYEIKTKYDTTKRLLKQVTDYLKAFEYVYVICPTCKVDEIIKLVPDNVGIYVYDDELTNVKFEIYREAKISNGIDRDIQTSVLHRNEKPSNLDSLSDDDVNLIFKSVLKRRYKNKWNSLCKNYKQINKLDYQYYFYSI